MKRKIFINFFLLATIGFFIYLIVLFAQNTESNYVIYHNYLAENDQYYADIYLYLLRVSIVNLCISCVLCLFHCFFIFYINKKGLSEIMKTTKERNNETAIIRQQKAEEKKQQQIRELEEKLEQLKKGE